MQKSSTVQVKITILQFVTFISDTYSEKSSDKFPSTFPPKPIFVFEFSGSKRFLGSETKQLKKLSKHHPGIK